jgi:hypothetical protein
MKHVTQRFKRPIRTIQVVGCIILLTAATVACGGGGGGGASTPKAESTAGIGGSGSNAGPTAVPTSSGSATASPTSSGSATASPTASGSATATPSPAPTYAFGGSSGLLSLIESLLPLPISLSLYQGITVGTLQLATPLLGNATVTVSDAINDGDITPSGFLADVGVNAAVAGFTPVVYLSLLNPTNVAISLGSSVPALTLLDLNPAFLTYSSCHIDLLGTIGATLAWQYTGSNGTPALTALSIAAGTLGGGGLVKIPADGQTILAITCH